MTVPVVAVCAASDAGLDALVDDRFARCAWFVLLDPGSATPRSVANEARNQPSSASSMAVAQLDRLSVNVVVGRRYGPKAHSALERAGIESHLTECRSVGEVAAWVQRHIWHR